MATAPKDETLVFLYVYLTGHPTADADYETTVGASGFDHTEFDNRQFASMDREQDRSTEGLVTPIGWLPIPTIERGEAYHSFRNSGRRA
ncbi:hypothetical protein ACK3BK_17020 [Pseudomonas sp. L7]|uniref:hypothetical protein n=1 Tax=Pseudomonas sp. L7 TaxID=3388343 RepID=UPI003984DD93